MGRKSLQPHSCPSSQTGKLQASSPGWFLRAGVATLCPEWVLGLQAPSPPLCWPCSSSLNCTVWAGRLIHGKNNSGKTNQVIFNPSQSHDPGGGPGRVPQSKVLLPWLTGEITDCISDKLLYFSSLILYLTALKSVHF